MSYALNLYHDQLIEGAAMAPPLPAAHRILYVRHGAVTVNGDELAADGAIYVGEALSLAPVAAWSQVWRWELAAPNDDPILTTGESVYSSLRMSRIITTLEMDAGSDWLFRLDRIIAGAGRVADRHQHPGPGIRCLVEGTFNVNQSAESVRDCQPGDAWWETGSDTVVAWGSQQMPTKFMRAMVIPTEWEGKATGTWLAASGPTHRRNWALYVDQIVTV